MASIFQRAKRKIWWIKYYANSRQVNYSLRTTDARVAKRIKREIEGEQAKGPDFQLRVCFETKKPPNCLRSTI